MQLAGVCLIILGLLFEAIGAATMAVAKVRRIPCNPNPFTWIAFGLVLFFLGNILRGFG